MKVLVIGAAGMLGRKLAQVLAERGSLRGRAIERLILADAVKPAPVPSFAGVERMTVDIALAGGASWILRERPDVIFHLAAVVSGEAEADFAKGYATNLDGTRQLFEAIRAAGQRQPYVPRLVYTSSLAVFGAPLPEIIPDDYAPAPLTSYGAQKLIGEVLLADYSRRGMLDGVGLRLPTIVVRPGPANRAASGFFSSIIREPLAGLTATLPVPEDTRHWFASPRAAIGYLLHAAELDAAALGGRRTLTMPGVGASVTEEIEALRQVAGDDVTRLIQRAADPAIAGIIAGWPQGFDPQRALKLGFRGEASFDEIIRVYLEDDAPARGAALPQPPGSD